jgi:hypothetical protein
VAVIRRRHVIYVEGYDPQGAEGYHSLFARSWKRFLKNWGFKARLGELQLESQDFAHWEVEAAGPNWQVATRYDFCVRNTSSAPTWPRHAPPGAARSPGRSTIW